MAFSPSVGKPFTFWSRPMPHTLAQKILQAHTDEEVREAGQIVNCHLSGVLANDITGPLAIKSFRAMARPRCSTRIASFW